MLRTSDCGFAADGTDASGLEAVRRVRERPPLVQVKAEKFEAGRAFLAFRRRRRGAGLVVSVVFP